MIHDVWPKCVAPERLAPTSKLPRLGALTFCEWIFGLTETCVSVDFEPEFLGTCRFFTSGKVRALFVPGVDVTTVLSQSADNNKDDVPVLFRKFVEDTNWDADDFQRQGVTIRQAVIDSEKLPLLVVPPGWFVMLCTLGLSLSG